MSETVVWFADADGTYAVTVGGVSVATGTCTATVLVTNQIPVASFYTGDNALKVTVTNANGSGFANVTIVRQGGTPSPGLCWSAPTTQLPREEKLADPLMNRLSLHMRQPVQARNVFILKSGRVVEDWVTPSDPIRVPLFGAVVGQKLSQSDADLLAAAGYGANLVACTGGFGTGGFGTGGFGG